MKAYASIIVHPKIGMFIESASVSFGDHPSFHDNGREAHPAYESDALKQAEHFSWAKFIAFYHKVPVCPCSDKDCMTSLNWEIQKAKDSGYRTAVFELLNPDDCLNSAMSEKN